MKNELQNIKNFAFYLFDFQYCLFGKLPLSQICIISQASKRLPSPSSQTLL